MSKLWIFGDSFWCRNTLTPRYSVNTGQAPTVSFDHFCEVFAKHNDLDFSWGSTALSNRGASNDIKWLATVLAVTGVFLQSADFMTAGKVAYALSSIAWVYVGHCWNDKAIMIGSAITGTAVLMNLAELFT